MAKLENVKTIDMVNGEITKVEYNGEIYAKVEGLPQKGDVALRIRVNYRAVTVGSFYAVTESLRGKLSYVDNGGDVMKLEGVTDRFTFFRKQSTPTLDERVSVLESKVATLEGEPGETIKQRITHEGAEYKLVEREAQPGDVVVFENEDHPNWLIKKGKPYVVVGVDIRGTEYFHGEDGRSRSVYYTNTIPSRTTDTVKVYEPVAQPLKVGDYAKVICEKHGHEFSIGDIVELAGDGHNPNFMALRVTVSEEWYVANEEIVRATDEEVAEAKAQAEQAAVEAKWAKIGRKPGEFKKGDIVRVVNGEGSTVKEGEIGEVGEMMGCGLFRVNTAHASQGNYQRVKDIELITPVESRFDRA